MSAKAEVGRTLLPEGDKALLEHLRIVERQLGAEFSGRLDPGEIRRLALASLTRFDDAPVRTFVPILAIREARRIARGYIAGKGRR